MEKNKRMTMIIIAGVLLLTVIGVTVAYFAVSVINGTRQNLSATTVESVNLTLDDNDQASFSAQISFGTSVTRNLKLTNEGGPTKVALYFQDLINTYTAGAFTYTLSYSTTENGSYTNVLTDVAIPRRSKASSTAKITEIEMPATSTRYYRIVITYNDLNANQTRDLTAQFNTGFTIKAVNDAVAITPTGDYLKDYYEYVIPGQSASASRRRVLGNANILKSEIDIIRIVNYSTPTSGTEFIENGSPWDVSEAQNGSIMAWIVEENFYDPRYEEENIANVLYIGQNGGVIANPNSSYLFYSFSNLTIIDASNLNTQYVTDMSHMFQTLQYLTSINLSNWDTSQVTNMSYMFAYLAESMLQITNNRITIDLKNLDVSNVTDMSYMFYNCKNANIDISGLNTSKVTNMSNMFASVGGLRGQTSIINVSGLNTENVTNMSSMFSYSGVTTLDLSSFDTASVTNMYAMFYGCYYITEFELSSFDTSNVTNMNNMFAGIADGADSTNYSTVDLDISNFDTASVTDMNRMFNESHNFKSIDMSDCDTSNVTDMGYMFSRVYLEELRLDNANFNSVTSYSNMLNTSFKNNIADLKIYVNENGKSFIDTNFSSYSISVVLV